MANPSSPVYATIRKHSTSFLRISGAGRMVNFMELIQQLSPFETPKINHVQRGFITDVRAQTLILILNRKVGNCLDVNSTISAVKSKMGEVFFCFACYTKGADEEVTLSCRCLSQREEDNQTSTVAHAHRSSVEE